MLKYTPGKKANQIVVVADHLSGKLTKEQREALSRHCAKTLGVNCKFTPILKSRCTITFDTPTVQDRFLKDFTDVLASIS